MANGDRAIRITAKDTVNIVERGIVDNIRPRSRAPHGDKSFETPMKFLRKPVI